MRRKGKFLAAGSVCALLLAVGGEVLSVGGGSAKADTIIPLPSSLTYLTQTVPDTQGGNSYLFISANSEIIVTDLAGKQIATIDSGDGIGGLALSANGGTLYASVTSGVDADSIAAITVSSIASATLEQVFYPLAAGDQPGYLAVQSDKVWVGYTPTADAVTKWQIGAIDLADDGTFEAAATPGSWTSEPLLAADPDDTGVLVAVDHESPAEGATYKTTTDPATLLAAQGELGGGATACGYLAQVAVMPGGKRFAAACMGAGVYAYNTADLSEAASYNANGAGASLTVGVAVDPDGTVAVSNRTHIYVYKPAGALLNTLEIGTGDEITEGEGLAWVDTPDGSGLAAAYGVGDKPPYAVEIFDKAEAQRPKLSLAPGNSTVSYKTVVHVTATLGTTYVNRYLTIYAEVNGSGKDQVIARGKVNAKGQLAVAYTALKSTTFLVAYTGDAEDAAAQASTVLSVRAQVREALSGQYGTKRSGGTTYLLYHRTGKITVATAVTPGHPGSCVEVETREFRKGAWHASTKTGCATLNPGSEATVYLTVGKAELGYPYRVRADYLSDSQENASSASTWQYVMVEK